tara:strand:- start:66 stop:245 length:180 start_codon:yes stop_codon:yes gene_type:complete
MKNYLAKPKLKSDYKELLPDYKGSVHLAKWGESGGLTHIIKSQLNPTAKKKYNKERSAA